MAAQAAVPGDHPRIRGEHQCAGIRLGERSGSSPHTRGAPQSHQAGNAVRGIIPAYAGSTAGRRRRCRGRQDHPRIRGEHRRPVCLGGAGGGSSPHTRGALVSSSGNFHSDTDHPRIRGEHSSWSIFESYGQGSSPHTRGAPTAARPRFWRRGIIPAYAGSTAPRRTGRFGRTDHPRIRGEHRILKKGLSLYGGSSPHTRGALIHTEDRIDVTGIIPAYAGSTSSRSAQISPRRDHPRIRGEHLTWWAAAPMTDGSSPHTRGALGDPGYDLDDPGIIPAYAGSTPTGRRYAGASADHPRIRGEHIVGSIGMVIGWGSSPHTRGAPARTAGLGCRRRIIPAYAGSTSPGLSRPPDMAGSSPHTRGALFGVGLEFEVPRIIPAYAGSTCSTSASPSSRADHPRIRGEHADGVLTRMSIGGSSPHTRGAPSSSTLSRGSTRIIPAYAGSTIARGICA